MLTPSTAVPVNTFEPSCASPGRSEQVLLDLPQALLVLLADRRLLFANANAEVLLTSGYALDNDGRLVSVGQLSAPSIEALLRQAHHSQGTRAGLWFADLQTGWLSVSRVPPSISSSTDWPVDSLLLLIHRDEPELTQPARIDALCQRCGLTRTERYVLLLLADGMAPQDIARQLALQLSTIRTHIRNLLGKTRSRSLMQLVRQVGSNAAAESLSAGY